MNTRWLRLAALVITCAMFAAGCDWTMFGYGPAHTRSNPWETRITDTRVDSLSTKWSGATGGAVRSSAAIVNGIAFIGSDKVYTFDAVTGAPHWAANVADSVGSSPAVVKGVVYVGSDDGKLYALDATTGTALWVGPTGGAVSSSPVVVNGVVYVGSADGKVYAFDATGSTGCSGTPKSCAPLWSVSTGGAVSSSPAVVNGVLYVGSNNGKLYALGAATGAVRWTAPTGGAVSSSPAVVNGAVYVGSADGKLYAFDAAGTTGCSGTPKSCAPLWVGPTGGAVSSSPAVAGCVVYVGSNDGKLYAFDATGTTGCSGAPTSCPPIWVGATGGAVSSSPAVAKGVVYVGSADGNVYAFDTGAFDCSGTPPSCTPLWVGPAGGAVRSSPAVVNGYVYVGSDGGKLHAFGLPKFFLTALFRHLPEILSPGESGTAARLCVEGSEAAIGGGFEAGPDDSTALGDLNVGQSEATTDNDVTAVNDPAQWDVTMTNNGPENAYFFPQSICASNGSATLDVVQRVAVASTTLAPGASGSSTAMCTGGEAVASGGYVARRASDGTFAHAVTVGLSQATLGGGATPNTWTVSATNNDTVNINLAARVTCVSAGSVPLQAVERAAPAITLAPGASGTSTIACRTGESATGGGFVAQRSSGGAIERAVNLSESETPDFGSLNAWSVVVTNHDTVNAKVGARVMCVS